MNPCHRDIQAILQIQRPRTKSGVRATIGLIGYHGQMSPNATEIMYPLTQLLRKNMPDKIKWNAEHDDALAKMKAILTSESDLAPYRFSMADRLF